MRVIASEFKRRLWVAEERDRGLTFMYHIRGADDHRTTKLSYWTRAQIPRGGLPMEKLEAILDEGVRLAKAGAFAEGGSMSGTPGKPILLPGDFRRRGFLIHFNDRDQVFRVA